jgi:hypothetical protein
MLVFSNEIYVYMLVYLLFKNMQQLHVMSLRYLLVIRQHMYL